MVRIGFQCYSLHAIDDPLTALLERVADTPFEGVEFAGLGNTLPDDVAATLDATGLAAAGMHVDVADIEADQTATVAIADALDCPNVVVPWLPPEEFEDRTAIDETAVRLDGLAEGLADAGCTLHYHNHDQEFTVVDGDPALTHLVDGTDTLRFELDLGWVGAAGHDPLAFLDEVGDRVDLVHLKDYDADRGEPVPVGDGDLDLHETLAVVREHDVDWLIYEAEHAPDTYETLDHAVAVVESLE